MNHPKSALDIVLAYHQETKHHLDRYARSLGYMDWKNQPDPFRQYESAPRIALDRPVEDDSLLYDRVFDPSSVPAHSLSRDFVSRLFFDSLALSAWKQAPGMKPWALRVNPSSGNLHPTEAYLMCGSVPDLSEDPALYHYSPFAHALERRIELTPREWKRLTGGLVDQTVLLVLTSIYWREAWKYGERAFRYCQHDIGHALGAVSLAAASMGWQSRLVETVSEEALRVLLALDQAVEMEAEQPECMVVLSPTGRSRRIRLPSELLRRLSGERYHGRPNQLSRQHHHWPIIDQVSDATETKTESVREFRHETKVKTPSLSAPRSDVEWRRLVRGRRSAVSMDASTSMTKDAFFYLLGRLSAAPQAPPFNLLPWNPFVSLLFFVHRVKGLSRGLYLLARNPEHERSLQDCLRPEFLWEKIEGGADTLPFFLLAAGDCRNASNIVSCHQSIAEDGAFSLGMLACFEPVLRKYSPAFYRRLHWECGLVGQLLYLEAEAAGLRGTGIGCFHDDVLHRFIGLQEYRWQTLYHFTVGGAREDLRLHTIPPYGHLGKSKDRA